MKHIYCPCINYKNVIVFPNMEHIISHLVCRGFVKGYIIWTKQGEGTSMSYAISCLDNVNAEGVPNMVAKGPTMVIERLHHYPQMDHVMQDVANDFSGNEGAMKRMVNMLMKTNK